MATRGGHSPRPTEVGRGRGRGMPNSKSPLPKRHGVAGSVPAPAPVQVHVSPIRSATLSTVTGTPKKKKGSKSKRRSKESSKEPSKESSKEPSAPPEDRSAEQWMSNEMVVGGANGMVGSGDIEEAENMTDRDKAIISDATKQRYKATHGSSSHDDSSSLSDDSSSSSCDDDDDIPMPKMAPVPDLLGASGPPVMFENPYAMDVDPMGGKELDTIITTSLKQLESARAFYERMQAQVTDGHTHITTTVTLAAHLKKIE